MLTSKQAGFQFAVLGSRIRHKACKCSACEPLHLPMAGHGRQASPQGALWLPRRLQRATKAVYGYKNPIVRVLGVDFERPSPMCAQDELETAPIEMPKVTLLFDEPFKDYAARLSI